MSISKFNRDNLRDFRVELEDALAEFGVKNGVSFDIGTIRFDASSARMKLTANVIAPSPNFVNPVIPTGSSAYSGSVDPVLDAISAKHLLPFGLKGRTVKHFGKSYTIESGSPNRPKFPFLVSGPQGGRYKMSVDQIREGLD